jgi:peptidoglycan/LPS O-acetylase OafA/YrhL
VINHSPGPAIPAIQSNGHRRDLRLDACRGLALWFVFIDHIPDNTLAWLTLRNYGFSDATEVFVFVSGYTCMLAYGGALREQGWPTTVTCVAAKLGNLRRVPAIADRLFCPGLGCWRRQPLS